MNADLEEREISRSETVLRWLSLLPAAVAGALAIRYLAIIGNRLTMPRQDVDPDSIWGRLFITFISSVAFSAAPIYIALWIAPSHKKETAVVMAGLILLVAGASLVLSLLAKDRWGIFEAGCMAFGSVGMIVGIVRDEVKY